MMSDDSAENRLSKFSNADRRLILHSQTDAELQHPSPPLLSENEPHLAHLLEHAIRGSGLHERAQFDASAADPTPHAADPGRLHERLIEELTTAQEQMRAEPPAQYAEQSLIYAERTAKELAETPVQSAKPLDYTEPAVEYPAFEEPQYTTFELTDQEVASRPELISSAPPEETVSRESDVEPSRVTDALEEHLNADKLRREPGEVAGADRRKTPDQKARSLTRRIRLRDWKRRRLAFLSHIHRHVFDRRTERLLFCKTPLLEVYHVEDTEKGPEKSFFYQGPIPRKLLDWALSAVPQDLKRYAFVDFRAGNGRTLLLAARHNFEYAAGYAFDIEGSETLEMNLAQYPRTYLACRDVRALRGDRDGVLVPSQPAVLFFPDSLSAGHLDVILTYVITSLRLDPRPIYLIFENAGRERSREQMKLFEKVRLPLLNQVKAFLFAPASIAVYRSKVERAS
jgi:hypothetical protein